MKAAATSYPLINRGMSKSSVSNPREFQNRNLLYLSLRDCDQQRAHSAAAHGAGVGRLSKSASTVAGDLATWPREEEEEDQACMQGARQRGWDQQSFAECPAEDEVESVGRVHSSCE